MSRQRFSGFSLLWNSLGKHQGWREQWRSAQPQAEYDAIIVGGGGHGLGTAYYLAAEHGLTRIAVIEKGWIGGGNTGRNTTIIRSNYLFDESARLYDHSVKMWEHLSQVLNYNVMFSPRGVMMLAHTVHDVQVAQRHIHANRCNGVDNEWLTPEDAKAFCPPLNIDPGLRYPVLGAALQRRGGTARHDAVAWGYARAADALGVVMRAARSRHSRPPVASSAAVRWAWSPPATRVSCSAWRACESRSRASRSRHWSQSPSSRCSPAS